MNTRSYTKITTEERIPKVKNSLFIPGPCNGFRNVFTLVAEVLLVYSVPIITGDEGSNVYFFGYEIISFLTRVPFFGSKSVTRLVKKFDLEK